MLRNRLLFLFWLLFAPFDRSLARRIIYTAIARDRSTETKITKSSSGPCLKLSRHQEITSKHFWGFSLQFDDLERWQYR